MSSENTSSSKALKWVIGTLGVLLLLASLGGFAYTGNEVWKLWKQTHPAAAITTTPVKPPVATLASKGTNGVPTVAAAKTAPAIRVPVDVIVKLAGEFIAEIIVFFVGIRLLQAGGKKKTNSADLALTPAATSTAVAPKIARRGSNKRWQSCNVLQLGETGRLWTFGAGKGGFNLSQEQPIATGQTLPLNLVGRDWRTLIQPKLNIAWLPVDQVFLRVAHLPVSELADTLAMVELQLEKLSPLPVTQIVWTVQMMPQQTDNLQTIIVIIVSRDVVEKILGDLEGQGFLADRLELPILDQLLATNITADGAYIYPDRNTAKLTALVAWWYGGTLRNLGLLHIPAVEGRDMLLKEQLTQMAWSGEVEGWLGGAPQWHLVADEETARNWQPMFRPWLGQSVDVLAPLTTLQLATMNANRAARSDLKSGILPIEYATRYQQEFVDRLWMRLVGVVLGAYVLFIMIYMAGAQWQGMNTDTAAGHLAGLSREYTNALQLKAQMEILQNRQALKFASLDCWKVTAEKLPAGLTVQTIEFKDGKHFSLSGVAPSEQRTQITDFYEDLRKATIQDQLMFEKLDLPQEKLQPGGNQIAWSLSGELANAEEVK